MINIKTSIKCAKTDFIKWALNSRMIILAVLVVFIYICAIQPLKENAALMGKPLNAIEPYIAALNSGSLLLIIPLGFLAISSDFPKIDGSAMFGLVRTGRVNWFCGQLLSLVMMSAAYLAFIFAASVIPTALESVWGTSWSDVALHFSVEFPDQAQSYGALLLPKNLFNHLSLTGAALQSTLFVFIYIILLGMIMMCFTILGKKTMGVIVCGGMISIGSALCSIIASLMWALPMANSIVWLHYTEFRRAPFYPIWCSGLYFGVFIVLLIILSLIRLKKFDCSANNSEG
ncbi:MAG: hypothetical protein K2J77_06260 [Oscillospiraceae bacterium]|nr:hypothetical protein [Oscillospiraceae bacterium]